MGTAALRFFFDDFGCLFLSADKNNVFLFRSGFSDEFTGPVESAGGLFQVNDVNAVTLPVDVRSHLGIPATGLVTEVHARFQKLSHRCYWQGLILL
ncbi:MAG: hypothetical protein BWY75_02930 [bacterium ADurb.Bin425]|nr:MAG: hypothetical protein BWY75_02930 [bacterium ADurb.Bin425]